MSNPTELPDLDRAEFEAWAKVACNMPFYANINWDALWTKQAWEGWQAHAALARRAQPEGEAPQADEMRAIDWSKGIIHKDGVTFAALKIGQAPQAEPMVDFPSVLGLPELASLFARAYEQGQPVTLLPGTCHMLFKAMTTAPAATLSPLCGAQHADSGEEAELCCDHPAFLEIMNDVLTPEGWVKFKNDEMVRLNSESIIDIFKAGLAAQSQGAQAVPTWGHVDTVADMVRNLLTLDQSEPIFSAFHVDFDGARRCRTSPISISHERVIDGKWVDSKRKDVPYATVVWAKPDERAAAPGAAIHYPECWDTAAYPTLESALVEVYAHYKCSECESAPGTPEAPQTAIASIECGTCEGKGQTRIHARPNSWRTCTGCDGDGSIQRAAQLDGDQEGSEA